jgi:hypothetical protein
MDIDLKQEWAAFMSAPEAFIALAVICFGGGWFLRRHTEGETRDGLREQIRALNERLGAQSERMDLIREREISSRELAERLAKQVEELKRQVETKAPAAALTKTVFEASSTAKELVTANTSLSEALSPSGVFYVIGGGNKR